MDYSNEFCEMCFQSDELQTLIHSIPTRKIMMERINQHKFISSKPEAVTKINFWLPSESQLQRLIPDKEQEYFIFLRSEYNLKNNKIPLNIFKSFEQYWLAFIMIHLFQKVWNGSSWIKLS